MERMRLGRLVAFLALLPQLLTGCAAVAVPTPPAVATRAGPPVSGLRVVLYVPAGLEAANPVWTFRYRNNVRTLNVVLDRPLVTLLENLLKTKFSGLQVQRGNLPREYDLLVTPRLTADLDRRLEGDRAAITLDLTVHLHMTDPGGQAVTTLTARGSGSASVTDLWYRRSEGWIVSESRGDLTVTGNLRHMGELAGAQALSGAMTQLAHSLRGADVIDAYAARVREQATLEAERRALPADLITSVRFEDTQSLLPNGQLDAGEEVELVVNVSNQGRGSGFGLVLTMATDQSHVSLPSKRELGEIPPGESREVRLLVKGGLELPSGVASLLIETRERRGYDARKVRLEIPTAQLVAPALRVVSVDVNDGTSGRARGNGNGIPENGETVELIATVENRGEGPALVTTVTLVPADPALEVVTRRVVVGTIPPGRRARGTVVLAIPRNYMAPKLDVRLDAEDVRGVGGDGYRSTLAAGQQRPVLKATHRMFDGGTLQSVGNRNGKVEGGEILELQITPENQGGLEAKRVWLRVASRHPGLRFQPEVLEIGDLPRQAQGAPQRVLITVPRNTAWATDKLVLVLTLEQEDFPADVTEVPLEVRLIRPEVTYGYVVRDRHGGNRLEQGQSGELEIRVRNDGEMEARQVRVRLAPEKPGVELIGPTEAVIGDLAPGTVSDPVRFGLVVRRSAPPGELPIALTLSHADFPDQPRTISLKVEEETATVIRMPRVSPTPVAPPQPPSAPMIVVASPHDGAEVSGEFRVTGGVGAASGVERVEIRLNKRPVSSDVFVDSSPAPMIKEGRYPISHQFAFTLRLPEGENLITVLATDVDGQTSELSLTVQRRGVERRLWAAIIGIGRYQHVAPLQYAVNDAKAFTAYLKGTLGIPEQNIFLLLDEQATLQEIKWTLNITLAQKAEPQDTVIIFYAGHGAPEPDSASPDGDGLEKYLVPHDAKPGALSVTGYPMREISALFRRIRAERVIFLADTCYSGASGGRTLFTGQQSRGLAEVFLDRLTQGKGRVIITAAAPNEVAIEDTQLRHGVFTYYLLEGLQGKADTNGDRFVTVDEAYDYVAANVRKFTRQQQNPVKKGETAGQLVLGQVQ